MRILSDTTTPEKPDVAKDSSPGWLNKDSTKNFATLTSKFPSQAEALKNFDKDPVAGSKAAMSVLANVAGVVPGPEAMAVGAVLNVGVMLMDLIAPATSPPQPPTIEQIVSAVRGVVKEELFLHDILILTDIQMPNREGEIERQYKNLITEFLKREKAADGTDTDHYQTLSGLPDVANMASEKGRFLNELKTFTENACGAMSSGSVSDVYGAAQKYWESESATIERKLTEFGCLTHFPAEVVNDAAGQFQPWLAATRCSGDQLREIQEHVDNWKALGIHMNALFLQLTTYYSIAQKIVNTNKADHDFVGLAEGYLKVFHSRCDLNARMADYRYIDKALDAFNVGVTMRQSAVSSYSEGAHPTLKGVSLPWQPKDQHHQFGLKLSVGTTNTNACYNHRCGLATSCEVGDAERQLNEQCMQISNGTMNFARYTAVAPHTCRAPPYTSVSGETLQECFNWVTYGGFDQRSKKRMLPTFQAGLNDIPSLGEIFLGNKVERFGPLCHYKNYDEMSMCGDHLAVRAGCRKYHDLGYFAPKTLPGVACPSGICGDWACPPPVLQWGCFSADALTIDFKAYDQVKNVQNSVSDPKFVLDSDPQLNGRLAKLAETLQCA